MDTSAKLTQRKEQKKRATFAFLMGLVTTMVISFAIVAINIGFNEKFLRIWLRSWMLAYCFVIPTILYVAPIVQKIINRIYDD